MGLQAFKQQELDGVSLMEYVVEMCDKESDKDKLTYEYLDILKKNGGSIINTYEELLDTYSGKDLLYMRFLIEFKIQLRSHNIKIK